MSNSTKKKNTGQPGRPKTTGVFKTRRELESAVRIYKDAGWSIDRISQRVGVARKTIYNLLHTRVDNGKKPE